MNRITGLLLLLAAFTSFEMMAQSALVDKFGAEAIASIQGTEKLAILEFQNENGYAVQDLGGIKDVSQYPDALEVEPVNPDTPELTEEILDSGFELFAYEFPTSGKSNNYYRVGDTGQLLVVYSIDVVKKKFAQNSHSK